MPYPFGIVIRDDKNLDIINVIIIIYISLLLFLLVLNAMHFNVSYRLN